MRICLIHYHEIGLKGHNRSTFEKRLLNNLARALADRAYCRVDRISGHILVSVDKESALDEVAAIIAAVPGVVKVSLGWRVGRELDEIHAAAGQALLDCGEFETFKVAARRSNTDFPLHSMELAAEVGAYLCGIAPDKKVKMKNPDVTVNVQVIQGSTYVFARSIPGVGGLPVGSAGKVVSLLSAGIDSPVATWKIMRRGAIAPCVHFSGRPQASGDSEYLVRELVDQLAPCAGIPRLYICPIGDYQREIALAVPPKLRVVMYRRLMFSVAEKIAFKEHAEAIVTGESLGQVASQTLSNIRAAEEVVSLPVLRPLIGADKSEIIERAQMLGTFDISIRNTSDCCTLFMPRNPETHAKLPEVHEAWDALPTDEWIAKIVEDAEVVSFR